MKRLLLLASLLAPLPAAAQQPRATLAAHLERALSIDAPFRSLAAQRDAVAARRALARSPIPGSPVVGGDFRSDVRGPREARELNAEVAAPVWLPGQRGAYRETVQTGVAEYEARLLLRRLEVAGLLRESLWSAASAGQEARVARDRLATSRDIARDVQRRADLGDIPPTDALLAQNETLAAELALAQAEAAVAAARAAYRILTGVADPDLPPPEPAAPARVRAHPALLAAEAGVAAAEAQARLVAATPRDNPELGLFGRHEEGVRSEPGVSLGLRMRIPLATDARNLPRVAAAQADLTRAVAERDLRRRVLEAEIQAARVALRQAEDAARIARQRLSVANRQLDLARRAFNAGEIAPFDLFRVRQLQVDAAGAQAQAEVTAGRARARLNQSLGVVPGGEGADLVSAR
jgi:outer membrane protein TolC